MTDPTLEWDPSIAALIERARAATNELRDAARLGRVIDFRQRDPLVIAIHDALDQLESAASALRGVRQQPQEPICKNCLHGWEAHINSAHIGDCRDVVADGSQCGCQHFSPLHTAALRGVRVTKLEDQEDRKPTRVDGA